MFVTVKDSQKWISCKEQQNEIIDELLEKFLQEQVLRSQVSATRELKSRSRKFFQSSLHYTRSITPKRVTSSGAHTRPSSWAKQLRKNVAAVASRWRHCVDLTDPGFKPLDLPHR